MIQAFVERIAEQPHTAAIAFGLVIGLAIRTFLDFLELKKVK